MIACLFCKRRPLWARGRCRACYQAYYESAAFERATTPRNVRCVHCGRAARSRGMCEKHYKRWLRNGDALRDHRFKRRFVR